MEWSDAKERFGLTDQDKEKIEEIIRKAISMGLPLGQFIVFNIDAKSALKLRQFHPVMRSRMGPALDLERSAACGEKFAIGFPCLSSQLRNALPAGILRQIATPPSDGMVHVIVVREQRVSCFEWLPDPCRHAPSET